MLRWLAILGFVLCAAPAWARDYDRNDVAEREISIGYGLSPLDVDTRAPTFCTDNPALVCVANEQRAQLLAIRGTARHHIRRFYIAGELELGATLPIGNFPAHPWLGVGGAVGLETANSGWERWRGYGELGVLVAWGDTRLAEMLAFTAEAGVRYQVQSTERPHLLLHLGLRGLYNFAYVGVMSFAGVSWTFD